MSLPQVYAPAFARASELMGMCPDLEPKSALKQAANDLGIPYGQEMEDFVNWAYAEIDDPDHDSHDDNRYPERI